MKQLGSGVNQTGWHRVLATFAVLVVAALVLGVGGTVAAPLVGVVTLASWAFAGYFVWLELRGKRIWLVVMLVAALVAAWGGEDGVGISATISAVMLSVWRYRPWRQLSARERARGFGLGVVALVLLSLLQGMDGGSALARLGLWSVWSLVVFWGFSLFHLAVHMRLHFVRLRPKLAISAVLIGVVPLLLMVVLGAMIVYATLGGARAARLNNTLDSWQQLAADGVDLSGALFDTTFVWPADAEVVSRAGVVVLAPPAWVPDLADGMAHLVAAKAVVRPDTTAYFLADRHFWLMRWQGLGTPHPMVQAWELGQRPLRELSRILQTGLDVESVPGEMAQGTLVVSTEQDSTARTLFDRFSVSYRHEDGSADGFWHKYLYFGGTLREILALDGVEVGTTQVFIQLRVGWRDLSDEFIASNANLNVLVVIVMGIAAGLWLLIEIFAVFFGLRITEGIVAGVHALQRGTQAVAAGDLETVIDIPNEDEFGDLADNFNEMILAVRHGREIALANERLTQELATARAIQMRLLPSVEPHFADFEVTGVSVPSREVGGDYYDFLVQGEDQLGVAIGDVSGKGMPAALLMSNLQASLHGQVLHPGTVSGVVARVNDLIVRSTDPHMFATFFYGVIEASTGTFTCTNAGHNPPLLLRVDGTLVELGAGGLLLGMLGDQSYIEETVALGPGEVIVLYTDGITEAVGPSAEEDDPEAMFGEEALYDVMRASQHLPAAEIKDAIMAAVTAHTSGVPQSDDITLVVIRRLG